MCLRNQVEATGDSLHPYDYQVLLSRFWFANQFVDDKDVVEFGGGSFICKEQMIAASNSYVVVDGFLPISKSWIRIPGQGNVPQRRLHGNIPERPISRCGVGLSNDLLL